MWINNNNCTTNLYILTHADPDHNSFCDAQNFGNLYLICSKFTIL